MGNTIIHVDMDAFFAAVEVRDDPSLAGKPLVIGALPSERGVVSTCSYEARVFGVRSAMSIKEAYRLCPQAVYMHPHMHKYKQASDGIHAIWASYTDAVEYVSLDEGYLDVTGSLAIFGSAERIGREIKARTQAELGLTCSVGIGYSLAAAKLASEERKPDGFFAIPSAEAFKALVADRGIRVLHGIGARTAEKLEAMQIQTVRDIWRNADMLAAFGKHGQHIVSIAEGIDDRAVTCGEEAKSIGREHTFQRDITDIATLKSKLRLLAKELCLKLQTKGIYCQTITLKITYADMKSITRAKTGTATRDPLTVFTTVSSLLDAADKRPIRLVGISLSGLTDVEYAQLSLDNFKQANQSKRRDRLADTMLGLQQRFGAGTVKTGGELASEQYLQNSGDDW